MQTLFNSTTSSTKGVVLSPMWSQARGGLTRNLVQVVNYHQTRNFAVRSNHLLPRILNSFRVSLDSTVERYYEMIDAVAPYMSMTMKLSNSIYQGQLWDGVFYGAGTHEIIVGHNEPFELYECVKDWKNAVPVKILDHCKTDLEMHIPNGVSYSNETGYAVIAVNLTMLAVMWRCFLIEQRKQMDKGLSPLTTPQFVHTYVLPNALASHLDIALVNRMVALAAKTPLGKPVRKHPMALGDYTTPTDRVLKETALHLKQANLSLHDMLCNIPAVTSVNAAEALQLPGLAPTRQYAWVEVVARVKVIADMLALSPSSLTAFDKAHLSYFTRMIDYSGMRQVIDIQMRDDQRVIDQRLDAIYAVAKRT